MEDKRINISQMLIKLEELYEKEEVLVKRLQMVQKEYKQLLDDKELLQNLIMYASNRNSRIIK